MKSGGMQSVVLPEIVFLAEFVFNLRLGEMHPIAA